MAKFVPSNFSVSEKIGGLAFDDIFMGMYVGTEIELYESQVG